MIRSEKGQVLILVALAVFFLLGMAALAIDVGFMYSTRHELQRCADAGALAGVAPFTTKDWNESSVKSEAEVLARDFASKDDVLGKPLDRDGEVAVTFPKVDHIAVDTSREVNMFFARIFGIQKKTITAHAMAKASPTNKISCVKPWAIPLPWVDNNTKNGLFDMPGEKDSVMRLCNVGEAPNGCWPIGQPMTLKVGSPSMDNSLNSGQQTSGQFFIIQGNVSDPYNGANSYREYIAGKTCLKMSLDNDVDLMPGNKMGPTVQPVEDLIASGDPWDPGTGYPPNPLPANTGDRLVYVVVYDPRVAITGGGNTGGSGTQAFIPGNNPGAPPTLWYAGFYLDNIVKQGNDGWITGRYTGIMLNGSGDPGANIGDVAKHPELVE